MDSVYVTTLWSWRWYLGKTFKCNILYLLLMISNINYCELKASFISIFSRNVLNELKILVLILLVYIVIIAYCLYRQYCTPSVTALYINYTFMY